MEVVVEVVFVVVVELVVAVDFAVRPADQSSSNPIGFSGPNQKRTACLSTS